MIDLTLIAIPSNNVRQTVALTGGLVTVKSRVALSSFRVTIARSAFMVGSIAVEARFALLAVIAVRVVQTVDTLSGCLVAAIWVVEVHVSVAFAFGA